MSYEYTGLLRHVIEKKRKTSVPSSPVRTERAPPTAPRAGVTPATASPQILNVAMTLSETAKGAVSGAMQLVQRTLLTMDRCAMARTDPEDLENKLRLAEAELSSVADSVKTTLEGVLQHSTTSSRKEESRSLFDGIPCGSVVGGVPHLLFHVECILESVHSSITSARIQLTLCKEEVRAFKARRSFLLSGGVGPMEQGMLTHVYARNRRSTVSSETKDGDQRGRHEDGEAAGRREGTAAATAETPPMQLRMVTNSKMLLSSVVNSVSHSMWKPDEPSSTSRNTPRRRIAAPTAVVTEGSTFPKGMQNIFQTPETSLEFTDTERVQLEQEHCVLLERQQTALAEEALSVEGAVKDLSHLNTLVNEALLTQREKFQVLMRNTEEAQVSVNKALTELKKPLNSFWNFKRQMVALLWICIVVLLFTNWLL